MNLACILSLVLQLKPIISICNGTKTFELNFSASDLIVLEGIFFHARYLKTISCVFDIDLPDLIPLGSFSCTAHDLGLIGLVCYVQLAKWVHLAEEFCAARELCFDYMELELS
jgi:hypothetical protein